MLGCVGGRTGGVEEEVKEDVKGAKLENTRKARTGNFRSDDPPPPPLYACTFQGPDTPSLNPCVLCVPFGDDWAIFYGQRFGHF
jgi:hypothetical protein